MTLSTDSLPAPLSQAQFEAQEACVLLPTYNNAQTLAAVIRSVQAYTSHIIVVNDGSTDNTADVLHSLPEIHRVAYKDNRGKGYALRMGFREAAAQGYRYAIVMDSDGQHYAHDLTAFLDQIAQTPDALIVGARNMGVDNVPAKSSFGNRFSNFWFWVNTGIRLPDTQSGYRLYPVQLLARKRYFTRKYEFEIEVMVRAAWSGIPVLPIPVSVYYPPADERVTHFRPFKDFTRISILNTVLVLIALLWIKPRDFVRLLGTREGWAKLGRALFVNPQESNARKAASVGFGVFMGIVPIWGLQLAVGIPLALLMRLNKALFLLAAHISVFPFTIFWVLASVATGKWLLGQSAWKIEGDFTSLRSALDSAATAGKAFLLGGCILAVTLGALAYLIAWGILLLTGRKRGA